MHKSVLKQDKIFCGFLLALGRPFKRKLDFHGDDFLGFLCVHNLVIVKKSSPKNLSANCQSTVGCLLADSWPTVGHLSADSWLIDSRQVLPKI